MCIFYISCDNTSDINTISHMYFRIYISYIFSYIFTCNKNNNIFGLFMRMHINRHGTSW